MSRSEQFLKEAVKYSANNYKPLDVVLERGQGPWVWDVDGKKYLDCLSAYSAVNQGHCHPRIVKAAQEQAARLTLTSRAFHNDQMGPFLHQLCELAGFAKALPMNSGRRGSRDGDQGDPEVGLQGQEDPRGEGGDHRLGRQLPRPHHDDHQLLHRAPVQGRLRAVHAGLQDHPVR